MVLSTLMRRSFIGLRRYWYRSRTRLLPATKTLPKIKPMAMIRAWAVFIGPTPCNWAFNVDQTLLECYFYPLLQPNTLCRSLAMEDPPGSPLRPLARACWIPHQVSPGVSVTGPDKAEGHLPVRRLCILAQRMICLFESFGRRFLLRKPRQRASKSGKELPPESPR